MYGMNGFMNSASACCKCGKAAGTSMQISRMTDTAGLRAVSVFLCLPDSQASVTSYFV